ncbi:MAG TPA: AAA family ATPase [Actinomycetota bacterium]|nr:AAA family ATPase [Actinomycetota bacterium]
MFVKRLRLSGFKSFADPTVMEFVAGVNVIVGPNGSGKSNVADALAWVLGSQAPSSLRGASMEDVIFAGSAGRPRLGVAEVELTLDNSSRVLPLDLNEVSISRSTDRAGQSEYKINGAPCRLLDITELLSDTGIGRSIHTIVGQGQLDTVLHARAEERRDFIEEAAQVGKYRRRKDRAVRKMERVDENLLRLNDVVTELRRAIKPLKRQASAAAMYSELVGQHRELKQRLTATEIHRLMAQEAAADPAGAARRADLLSEELGTIRAQLDASAGEREARARVAQRAQEVATGIARSGDRLASLAQLAEERAARIDARLAAETEEGYRERIRLLERDVERWSREHSSLVETATAARERARSAAAAADEARRTVEAADGELAAARGHETEAAQALVRAEGREAAGRATLESLEARVQAVVERRRVAENTIAEQGRSVAAAEADVERLEAELDTVTTRAAAAEARLEEERERADRLREHLGGSHADAAAARARVDALTEVVALFSDEPHVIVKIEPLVRAAQESEQVARAGEDEALTIVAEADATVEQRWQDVAREDEELRRLDALLSGAAERLAGSKRLLEAREIELAALEDELARANDALAGARTAAIEEQASLPAFRAATEEAARRREIAESSLATARSTASEALRHHSECELEARTADERALSAELRKEEAESGIADAQTALAGLADLRATLTAARTRAIQVARAAGLAAVRAESWAVDAQSRARAAREHAEEGERKVTELRSRERELRDALDEVTKRRNEAEIVQAQTRARVDALGERAMEEWGLSVDALKDVEPIQDAEEEADARDALVKLERDMKRLGAVNPNAAEEYSELAERERFLEEQMEDLRNSKRDLMKVVREVDETIIQVFSEAFADVAREFEAVFARLFPGGSGKLLLTDPTDLLTTGVEVEARPPGKNVKKLSLLSGGERSLVALAFLFAIFRSRPSPFYLLDEVEAALDDVNLQRFLTLIDELEERAQVLIVTHQKRTMEAADVLYGVSMGKQGVSLVVAKRMEELSA